MKTKHLKDCACLGWGEFYIPGEDKFEPCEGQMIEDSSQSTYEESKVPKMIPTIGRRVWYKNSQYSDQFCDAGVAYVHSPSVINISFADNVGIMYGATSVVLIEGTPEECKEGQACWMPYQAAQAKKLEDIKNQI